MTPPERLLRVALYLRAHTMALAAEQAVLLMATADKVPQWRVAAFCDINPGAARPGRTGALRAAGDGGFDLLLVGSLDRLTRSTGELHEFNGQLTAADVLLSTVGRRPSGRPGGDGDRPDLVISPAARPTWCGCPCGRRPITRGGAARATGVAGRAAVMGYRITRPLFFGDDRLPSVQIGTLYTGGIVSWDLTFAGRDHTLWRLRIRVPGRTIYDEREAIRQPVRDYGRGRQAAEVLSSVMSLLLADAEAYRSSMGRHVPDDGWVFTATVAEWAYQNDTELQAMADQLAGAR